MKNSDSVDQETCVSTAESAELWDCLFMKFKQLIVTNVTHQRRTERIFREDVVQNAVR